MIHSHGSKLSNPPGIPGYSNNIEGLGMGAAQTGPNAELFVPFQPYYRPKQFKRRVATLVGVTCASMFLLFVFIFSVPVSLGRFSVFVVIVLESKT